MKKLALLVFGSILGFAFVLSTSSADAAYVHTVTLKYGVRSTQVMSLQQTLNLTACKVALVGAGSPGMETMYFGPATRAAVRCFQASQGIGVDGVVGPVTGGRLALVTGTVTPPTGLPAGCTSTSGFSPVTGQPCSGGTTLPAGCLPGYLYSATTGQPCTGTPTPTTPSLSGYGTIQDFNKLGQYNNEDVGEGQNDVRIAGFDVQASNEGDILLRSIRLTFDPSGSSGSTRLNRYINSVTIWQGSTKVGSADVEDFNKDSGNIYSRTITLNNAVVKRDQTQRFYITVDAANTIDSADLSGDSWTVNVDSVRYEDATGVVTTDTTTGDINSMNVPINFTSFNQAANTELRISTANDNPTENIVVADNNNTTDNVTLLKGTLRLSGDSDVTINELPVTFTTTGATGGVGAVTNSVTLRLDNEEYTESVSTSASTTTVVFNNLDYKINAGDTVDFTVLADINNIDAGSFDEGGTLTASINSTNRDAIDVENQEGDQLDNSDLTGTAIGNTQTFRTNGISLSLVSTNATSNSVDGSGNDLATFTIRFKVTAVGDDAYLATTAANYLYELQAGDGSTTAGTSAAITNDSTTTLSSNGNWYIPEGETKTFTLTIFRSGGTAGLYRAALTGVKWSSTDDTTPDNTYTTNLTQYRTNYIALD